ncbi:hypothetical protein MRX58_06245 [Xylella fastidiosa subsp. pauca]|uniref:hypothetical protein n=1 Tax=Xylella fastidiosa TaxID=2371 RepID=UPI00117D31B0|nr:hypothetical protein [Xylella fastidiosa]MDG5823165.1 hypothetical protein [Xylella fastidiosa subsp. pauca]
MINATHGCRATTHGPTHRAICATNQTPLATATPLIWSFWRCTTGVRPSLQCMVIVALLPLASLEGQPAAFPHAVAAQRTPRGLMRTWDAPGMPIMATYRLCVSYGGAATDDR